MSGVPMSEIDIPMLIMKVFQKPEIWDSRIKGYNNNIIANKSWQEISNEMGVPDAALRKKWKYLRDQFCVETGKAARSKAQKVPKWPHYMSLLFLKSVVKPRSNTPGMPKVPKIEGTEDAKKPRLKAIKKKLNDSNTSAVDPNSSVVDSSEVKQDVKKPRVYKRKKTIVENAATVTYQIIPSAEGEGTQAVGNVFPLEIVQEEVVIQNVQVQDEDLLFFKSLLPYVSRIPEDMKLSFRNRVQEVVGEYVPNCSLSFG